MVGGGGPWGKPLATAVLLVGIAIGLVGNLATGAMRVSGVWVPVSWVATGVLIVVAVLLALVEVRSSDAGVGEDGTVAAARVAVRRQWEHEVVLRRLRQPFPLRVRWASTV